MSNWGQETAPNEACGLWIPATNIQGTHDLWLVDNIAEDPLKSYKMDMVDVSQLMERHNITGPGEFYEQVIVWHTHPSGMVGPSKGDIDASMFNVKYMVMTIPSQEVVKYERVRW